MAERRSRSTSSAKGVTPTRLRQVLRDPGGDDGLAAPALPPAASSGLAGRWRQRTSPDSGRAGARGEAAGLPVIWLEFQDCAGCTEALTRSQSPTLVDLVLNQISIDYHETLFAAAGFQAEEDQRRRDGELRGQVRAGRRGEHPDRRQRHLLHDRRPDSASTCCDEAAAGAAAIIATGNCAAFGGLPKAEPNPTDAKGVWEIITDKTGGEHPRLPGDPRSDHRHARCTSWCSGRCPNSTISIGPRPSTGRPSTTAACAAPSTRRASSPTSFDDEGARKGWCLYKLGCKGPTTYNACATMKWDAGLSFPIQSGHPCLGCSEPNFWDGGGFYQGQSAPLERPTLIADRRSRPAAGAVIGAGRRRRQPSARRSGTGAQRPPSEKRGGDHGLE